MFVSMPPEILMNVFTNLKEKELGRLSQVRIFRCLFEIKTLLIETGLPRSKDRQRRWMVVEKYLFANIPFCRHGKPN